MKFLKGDNPQGMHIKLKYEFLIIFLFTSAAYYLVWLVIR